MGPMMGPMKNVRIDDEGNLRCWKCGSRSFTEKRTGRAKAAGVTAGVVFAPIAAVGILGTKKKLRCQACGEYNDVGSAEPMDGAKAAQATPRPVAPAASGWRKVRADQLQPGDVISKMGTTSTVESVEPGKLGLRVKTSTGMLRGIGRAVEFTIRRPSD